MANLDDPYVIETQPKPEDTYQGKRLTWLADAVRNNYEAMRRFRSLYKHLVEAYAGPGYLGTAEEGPRHLQKLSEALEAYQTLLAGGEPQVMIETHIAALDQFAFTFQQSLNHLAGEIHLHETIERWVLDACVLVGIIKTHVAESGRTIMLDGLSLDPGVANASNVSVEDFVVDMTAKRMRTVKFAGDRYRVSFAKFQESVALGTYDEQVAKDVRPSSKRPELDESIQDSYARGQSIDPDDVEPMVDLLDVWVPRDSKVYTFVVTRSASMEIDPRPLAEMDWLDHEQGPYHILGFRLIPDAIFPKSPAVHLNDLNTLIDNIMSLTARQAKRQKQLTAYEPGSEDDAAKIRTAPDGTLVKVANLAALKPFIIPGADPATVNLLLQLLQLFDVSAGNLTAMMGLGAQTDTVGQENLIHQAGNRKVQWMQNRVGMAVGKLFRSLGFLLWHDEFKNITTRMPAPGAERYHATIEWNARERAGNFWDYNFQVNATTLARKSPDQTANAVGQLLMQVFLPMAESLAAQGGRIDLAEVAEMYADLLNQPRLRKIVVFDQTPNQNDRQPSASIRKPQTSNRHYTRHNTGGGQRPGPENYFASAPSLTQQLQAPTSGGPLAA